ncbi:Uncharacterised protein [Pseudomonas aeruginosa]|nr:Uncharacterised protein [Pseudomonas aeruginosa]
MPKWIALCLIPLLASCATCRQDSDREKLLYENDMLQAKLIIVANDRDRLPLAQALLERAARDDRSGEADFYQAVLIARRDGQASDCERITRLLERSAEATLPAGQRNALQDLRRALPVAARRHSQGRDLSPGLRRAAGRRAAATPSFERARQVVDRLLAPTSS